MLQTHVPRIESPKRTIADEAVPQSQSGPRCFQELQRKETKGNKWRYREVLRSEQLNEVLQYLVSQIDSLEATFVDGIMSKSQSVLGHSQELQRDERRGNKGDDGEVLRSQKLEEVLQTLVSHIHVLEGATEDEAAPQSQSALGHLKQLEREEWRARKKRQRYRQKAVQQGQDPQTPGCTTADWRQTAIESQREQWKQQKRQQRERQRAAKQGQAAANSVPCNLQPDLEHLEELKRKQWREKKQRQRANKRAALQNEVPQALSPRSANPECTQPQSNTSERTIRRHAAKISDAILAFQDDDVAALAMKKALNRKEFKHIRATLGMNTNKE